MAPFQVKFGRFSVAEFVAGGENVVLPFGFETSTVRSGIRLSDGDSYNAGTKIVRLIRSKNSLKASIDFEMAGAKINLNYSEKVLKNLLARDYAVTFLEDSDVLDLVQRFRFKKQFVDHVEIAGKSFFHESSNTNHIYPTNEVKVFLCGRRKRFVRIKALKVKTDLFRQYFYVRDSPGEWVVHFRLLPTKKPGAVVMLNHPALEMAFPNWLSRIILANKKIKGFLWYKGEKGRKDFFSRIPFNAYALQFVPKGAKIKMITETKVY